MSSTSGMINMVINGTIALVPTSCPVLDPTASIQISETLIDIYQSRIDALINQLGKHVLLEFTPIPVPCINCFYDVIRKRSNGIYRPGGPRPFVRKQKCPYCKGRGFLEEPVNECIHALLKWNPKEAEDYGIAISQYQGVVRIKTYLQHITSLMRAETAIVNYAIKDILTMRVKKIKGPIPVGLREDRYCISFWELI